MVLAFSERYIITGVKNENYTSYCIKRSFICRVNRRQLSLPNASSKFYLDLKNKKNEKINAVDSE